MSGSGAAHLLHGRCCRRRPIVLLFLPLLCLCFFSAAASRGRAPQEPEPEFADVIPNATVPVGRDVKFPCTVKNLGSYKVAWIRYRQSAILTVQNHVITRNPRISVSHDRQRTFFLHIRDVRESDRGMYMCQINTVKAKSSFAYLGVEVPPNILDEQSSRDARVREGSGKNLTCRATGSPLPRIYWEREDERGIPSGRGLQVAKRRQGDTLHLESVSRSDMGWYLCVARNGVPPSISKRIHLTVEFPPNVSASRTVHEVPQDHSLDMECLVDSSPAPLSYWHTRKEMILRSNEKFVVRTVRMDGYRSRMLLRVNNVAEEDFGEYECIARNTLGEMRAVITVHRAFLPEGDERIEGGNQQRIPVPFHYSPKERQDYLSSEADASFRSSIHPRFNLPTSGGFQMRFRADKNGMRGDCAHEVQRLSSEGSAMKTQCAPVVIRTVAMGCCKRCRGTY